jgi:two-component system, cell cycle sensor histidine kinase and response regulator CckA
MTLPPSIPVNADSTDISEQANIVKEREEIDEALRRKEECFLAAFKFTSVGFAINTLEGRFLQVNPAFCALTGYTAEELLRTDYRALTHPDDLTDNLDHHQQMLSGAIPGFVIAKRYIRKDGTLMWSQTGVSLMRDRDGNPTHIVAVIQDITDRKRAEEALRHSEQRYRSLFEGIPQPMLAYDEETLMVLATNEAAARQYGFTREEFSRRTIRDIFSAEDVANPPESAAGAEEKFPRRRLTRHRKKNGSFFDVEEFSHRLYYGGRPAFITLAIDVTERHRLHEQLRQAQKMEAIGQLAGGVAHDFNNLLTVINGYGDLLWNSLPASSPESELVDEIRKAGERASTLTRQLLTFSRKQVLAPATLNLNTVLNDLQKMLHRMIGEDIELATCLDPDLGHIFADPGQMEQVIVNLVINARDAMPGGGKLTVATRNVVLDGRKRGHVLLTVSDTGCGMFPEVKARLFEPFFTTKAVGKGTGLGLAMVSSIVAQNDGYIEVESEPGVGSTFRIYLPRVDAPVRPSKAVPVVRAIAGGSETVLLVEDEDSVRSLTRMLLEQRGYRLLEARSGADALRLAEQHREPIHLLVTDVVMPGMSGRELAERLTALHPEMRVLYLSGYNGDTSLRYGVRQDERHFLAKPFSPVTLARKVREVLDQRREPCPKRRRSGSIP